VSSQPSSVPTLSARPSSQPSAGPTLSAGPSSNPSAGPTASAAPSSPPTALDSDNDGVPDFEDQCKDEGGHVDEFGYGCPIDTDNDGIPDCVSNLHPTLSGCDFDPRNQATFNSTCCNLGWDRCFSDTPAGAFVQDTAYTVGSETIEPGCIADGDGDGVVDGLDQCPDTTQVEKELAALADGKMTLDTTGPDAGCAILNETVWDSIFLDVLTNSDGIVSDPGLEAVFAVNPAMTSVQEARVVADGGSFGAESIARFTVLDPKCIRKYNDVTQSGDTLFTITPYLNDNDRYSGQVPEGTVLLSADIDFNAALLTQSPLWELEYPFSIGTVSCCIRLELISDDGDVQATHEVVSITRYNMNQGFAVEDTEMADVVREQASEAIEWVDVHYPLTACQCDYFDVCLDNDPTSPTFNGGVLGQGDELKICIYFDDTDGNSLPDSYVKIADIKTFTCNKEGTSLIHMPIGDNRYANGDGLTSVKINNGDATDPQGRMVKVGTILPPAFFDREPGTAACEGIVQYDFVQGENIFSKRRQQRVLIEAPPSRPVPESRLPGGSAKSVFNVEIGLAAAWDPAIFASTSTIKFSRGFLYGVMIMFASVAMLLVARPGSYGAFWRRLPCSKYEIKIEKDGLTRATGLSTMDGDPPVAHIFVHENDHEQDETYTQMSSSQFGLSAVSSTMVPPVKHDLPAKRRNSNDPPSQGPWSSFKRRPSMDFFKRNSKEDVMAEPTAHAESGGRSVHFMIDDCKADTGYPC